MGYFFQMIPKVNIYIYSNTLIDPNQYPMLRALSFCGHRSGTEFLKWLRWR